MNCKPGEVAVLVNTPPEFKHYIGMVVRVLTPIDTPHGEVGWLYEGPRIHLNSGLVAKGIEDRFLRPLRSDEGDDETLSWLPVPSQEPSHV